MEDERDIKVQLLLAVHEAKEWDEVVYKRFRHIFRTDKVKSYSTNAKVEFEFIRPAPVGWCEPATRSGNSFLRARQSSVNQSSSSGVITLMVV